MPLTWALVVTAIVTLQLHAFVPAACAAALLTWFVRDESNVWLSLLACVASTAMLGVAMRFIGRSSMIDRR